MDEIGSNAGIMGISRLGVAVATSVLVALV